jgi:hypothetical protein
LHRAREWLIPSGTRGSGRNQSRSRLGRSSDTGFNNIQWLIRWQLSTIKENVRVAKKRKLNKRTSKESEELSDRFSFPRDINQPKTKRKKIPYKRNEKM